MAGFNKYGISDFSDAWYRRHYMPTIFFLAGLLHNDCLYETPDVKEALKRLPPKILDERAYRQIRAMNLSATHRILPKEQWTKWDEDVRYLEPYLEEVERERLEREDWEDNH